MSRFTFYRQLNAMDCGPTCLRMIARYHGRHYNTEGIREIAGFSKEGVSLLGISKAAENIGLKAEGLKLTFGQLTREVDLPCILHWNQNHFVVLLPVRSWFRKKNVNSVVVADPGQGIITYAKKEFLQHWISTENENGEPVGTALLLAPDNSFYQHPGEKESKLNWNLLFKYLKRHYWPIIQVLMALLIASLLQLVFPFLTQSIVDIGIDTQNLNFITIILIAQLTLVISRTVIDFIRSRLLLNISCMLNLSILSDFWDKLTHLPVSYFDRHQTGDTLQRIGDNKEIQGFLTGPALNTIYSFVNFIVYAAVLILYSPPLFVVFVTGSILYIAWIRFFLKFRRKINYQIFHASTKENNATLQLVQGMQEIRINNAEKAKKREWLNMQVGIFKLTYKNLSYSQVQQAGAILINQGKDILITFLVSRMVVQGHLTLGAMLAIQYIIGQLNGPIEQFIGFVQTGQDAKISMERLNEIHQLQDEEPAARSYLQQLPLRKTIQFSHLTFSYPNGGTDAVLRDLSFEIPEGKVTAIVGVSGSGKTTLLKLLLKIYDNYSGRFTVGQTDFSNLSPSFWRSQCGAVLQDGYIFNDTIANNIALGTGTVDFRHLKKCCAITNILSFIESLPNGFNTQLGADGTSLSAGQKQRLLIARAIYKNPEYLFFDEATNSLDANNERTIVENLQEVFEDKTVVIVAHRLSTVKHADKIVVLHEGRIVEEGNHKELSTLRGRYYELVKNQLELGN
ncbi:MAG TPA: peptidase domain-containing ABC transporter [Puia sp.]